MPLIPTQGDASARFSDRPLEESLENRSNGLRLYQADLGICGIGMTPEEAFSEGAREMPAAMADQENIRPEQEWIVHCPAHDPAFEWLNELLYRRTEVKAATCSGPDYRQEG